MDGSQVEFVHEQVASGAMKDVYFSPDKDYVVAFFRKPQNEVSVERLKMIVGPYRESIFAQEEGAYWKDLFCWPERLVLWNNRIGVVCPTYSDKFYFREGRFQGKEKEGKWFSSAKLRNRFLQPTDKGNWMSYLGICIKIARAVRRLHAAGLAHSDLSYKNVLVDPLTSSACIIDCDGLVVPGKFPPEVVGTPDFIAPEVLQTQRLSLDDPGRVLPSIYTDRHALAVLIYMYLLYRHPLRGGMLCDPDPAKDEELSMGKQALFIEHPTDKRNRPNLAELSDFELPQCNVSKRPYTLCGPYLSRLFEQAFIEGLHDPSRRPSAAEWEEALVKTVDLLYPCNEQGCEEHWFVNEGTGALTCPFCGKRHKGLTPVLNFYYAPKGHTYLEEHHKLQVYDNRNLFSWQTNNLLAPNERLSIKDRQPVGDFHLHKGQWILVNRNMSYLRDVTAGQDIPVGGSVTLTKDKQLLLGREAGSRLAVVQIAGS